MPARIIVDSNEPIEIYEVLKSLLGSVDRRRLEPCDYLIGGEVCIERKTPRDFLNSIYDGRVFDQVRRILEVYERAILLIEGPFLGLTQREGRVIAGAMAGLLRMGASVVCLADRDQTCWFIAALAREGRGGPVVARRRPKLASLSEAQLYVLTSVPGIGPKSAEALLRRFGTLKGVFQASFPELRSVIGEKRAQRLRDLLEARYTGQTEGEGSGSLAGLE